MSEQQQEAAPVVVTPRKKVYPPIPSQWRNPLMAERLKKYRVPVWPGQPSYDRIYVYQIPTVDRETYVEGGVIIAPERAKDRQQSVAPRGILLAAGLKAMGQLVSHGYMLGDVVWFARFSRWAVEVEGEGGKIDHICFMRAADLVCSEDALERLRNGQLEIEMDGDGDFSFAGRKRIDVEETVDEM